MRVVRTPQLHCSGKQAIYSERKRDTEFLKIQSFVCQNLVGDKAASVTGLTDWLRKSFWGCGKRGKNTKEKIMCLYTVDGVVVFQENRKILRCTL